MIFLAAVVAKGIWMKAKNKFWWIKNKMMKWKKILFDLLVTNCYTSEYLVLLLLHNRKELSARKTSYWMVCCRMKNKNKKNQCLLRHRGQGNSSYKFFTEQFFYQFNFCGCSGNKKNYIRWVLREHWLIANAFPCIWILFKSRRNKEI